MTASANAADQLRRLLTLIPRLADGDAHPVADVATIVGISADQLIDDLRSLVERFDTPGGFVDGVQIYHEGDTVSVVTPHFLRPMRLTMPELCALELGLAILRSERPAAEVAPIERAIARLRSVIAALPSQDAHDDRLTGATPAGRGSRHLGALRAAIRQRRKARILYQKGSAGSAESRVVCPYNLAFASGMWYVVAHCDRASALRIFRLDRIADVAHESATYEVPSDFSVDDLLVPGKAVATAEGGIEMLRVRYSPRIAKWIAEREGRALEPDGSLIMDHPIHDDAWAVRQVLQYGADAEALSPDRIRGAIVRACQSLTP